MAIDRYDPLEAPDAQQWLATDESQRLALVLAYHARVAIELPNARMHATMHVAVENQVALGDAMQVQRRLRQLMAQGVDRHQALHAIAAVLIGHMSDLLRGEVPAGDPNQRYYAALKRINARKWLRSG